MPSGSMTVDLPLSDTITDVIGNGLVSGVPDTVRQTFEKLSTQLASTGPLSQKIEGAADGLVEVNTWLQLNAIPGTRAGQPGQAIGPDAGTHTDPVVGGGPVPNEGKYTWSTAPAGWRRIADYQAVTDETIDEVYDAIALKADDNEVVKLSGDQVVAGVKTHSSSPLFPTVAPGTNNTQAATTAFVKAAIDALLSGAPGALDTLNELAASLGNDANFAATVTNALALKAPLNNPTFTGTVSGITKAMVGLAEQQAQAVAIASATSIDLGAAVGETVVITGTETISSLGTATVGTWRRVIAGGAFTLVHHATQLRLLGGENIPVQANDVMEFVSRGSGNWHCCYYSRFGDVALKAMIDELGTAVDSLNAAIVLRGTWNASAGTFPGGGSAQAGDSYIVSVAGTVGGVAFNVDDRIIAITDNASTSTFAGNWFKADYTDQVLSVAGKTGAVSLVPSDVTGLPEALQAEEDARIATDTALGAAIDAEETAREDGDDALGEEIDAETEARSTLIESRVSLKPDPPAWTFTDLEDRIVFSVPRDFGGLPNPQLQPSLVEKDAGRYVVLDEDERVLFDSGDFLTAIEHPEYMRQTATILRRRRMGVADQLSMLMIGDSLSHVPTYWSRDFSAAMKAAHGDAGLGYFGFGSGNPIDSAYVYTSSGTWEEVLRESPTPDICIVQSSEVGARKRITGPATPVISAARLVYMGTVDGEIRYRWNDGTWSSSTALSGSTLGNLVMTGFPTSGAWSLDVEVTAGEVHLGGVIFSSAASGVRIHKLAISGSQASDWAAVDATDWKAGVALCNPQAAMIMLGINDRGFGEQTPAEFKTNLGTIVDNLRDVSGIMDVLIQMSWASASTTPIYPMEEFSRAARLLAREKRCSFRDLQFSAGARFTDYEDGTAVPLLLPDKTHPTARGGALILDGTLGIIDPRI